MLIAMLMDISIGWPKVLFQRIRHPVVWIGFLISVLERHLNQPGFSKAVKRCGGCVITLLVTGMCGLAVFSISTTSMAGLVFTIIIATSMLAIRSLYEHVNTVLQSLTNQDLQTSREAVVQIVGRDVSNLSTSEIASAAIESLAESTCDGVVAPLFWGCLLGLPGLVIYKALNTMDSMIGHRNTRYEHFGWCAARCDDFANYLPARLTAFFILLSTLSIHSFIEMVQDARHHRSVNAGWPEAALAYALQVRLSGPRSYAGRNTTQPWINETARAATATHLANALRGYNRIIAIILVSLSIYVGMLVSFGIYPT